MRSKCKHHSWAGDSLRLEDGQAVQLEDGTTAFIHHASKGMGLWKYMANNGEAGVWGEWDLPLATAPLSRERIVCVFEVRGGQFGHSLRRSCVILWAIQEQFGMASTMNHVVIWICLQLLVSLQSDFDCYLLGVYFFTFWDKGSSGCLNHCPGFSWI